MKETLTVCELAAAVDKAPGYVRQHIHRGHLETSRDERGRVVIDSEEAWRWAKEKNLIFRGGVNMSGATHAIIMPFPVANLVTWCGHRCDSLAVKDDFIASSPQEVTCQRCMEVMREAHANLERWIPRLSTSVPGKPLPSPPDGILGGH
jgi:hypothetical protein